MDSTQTKSTAPIGVNPRHLGLPRRQSYDPLSSTKGSLGLSLGQLPPPTFGNIPAGLRSVPAVESNRHFGSAFRNHVTTPNGDGQRTPGGSLVIGAEVFGFGAALKKEPRERWGTGAIESAASQTEEPSDWPSAFDTAAASQRTKHGSSSISAVSRGFVLLPTLFSFPPCSLFLLRSLRIKVMGKFFFGQKGGNQPPDQDRCTRSHFLGLIPNFTLTWLLA